MLEALTAKYQKDRHDPLPASSVRTLVHFEPSGLPTYRLTVRRSIPSSRAIARFERPRFHSVLIVSICAILSVFDMPVSFARAGLHDYSKWYIFNCGLVVHFDC